MRNGRYCKCVDPSHVRLLGGTIHRKRNLKKNEPTLMSLSNNFFCSLSCFYVPCNFFAVIIVLDLFHKVPWLVRSREHSKSLPWPLKSASRLMTPFHPCWTILVILTVLNAPMNFSLSLNVFKIYPDIWEIRNTWGLLWKSPCGLFFWLIFLVLLLFLFEFLSLWLFL